MNDLLYVVVAVRHINNKYHGSRLLGVHSSKEKAYARIRKEFEGVGQVLDHQMLLSLQNGKDRETFTIHTKRIDDE